MLHNLRKRELAVALRAKIARLQQHLTQYQLVKVPSTCIPGNIPGSSIIRHFHNRNKVASEVHEVSVANFYVYVPGISRSRENFIRRLSFILPADKRQRRHAKFNPKKVDRSNGPVYPRRVLSRGCLLAFGNPPRTGRSTMKFRCRG